MEYAKTIPDVFLYEIFEQMKACGRFKETFYDGELQATHHAFRDFMKDDTRHAWAMLADSTPAGMCWLSNATKGTALTHFCFLPVVHPLVTLRLARFFTASVLRMREEEEEKSPYILHTLHGMTPVRNKQAVRFIGKAGFKAIGELPAAVYIASSGQCESAIVSYATRQTAPELWAKGRAQ